MSEGKVDYRDLERRMDGAVSVLKTELSGLRTGRASVNLLDPVMVNAYGAQMPINQVSTVSVPDARMLSVQVWDQSLVNAVDKAIRDADLGLNPMVEGNVLRIPIPELNAEPFGNVALCSRHDPARIAIDSNRHHRHSASEAGRTPLDKQK